MIDMYSLCLKVQCEQSSCYLYGVGKPQYSNVNLYHDVITMQTDDYTNRTGVFSRFDSKAREEIVTIKRRNRYEAGDLITWISENTEDIWNLCLWGEDVTRHSFIDTYINYVFSFRSIADAVHFKLRWS